MVTEEDNEVQSQDSKKRGPTGPVVFGTFSDKEIDDLLANFKLDLNPDGDLQRTLSESSAATQTAVLQFRSIQGEFANKLQRVAEPALQ
jgi:hypothetical protein